MTRFILASLFAMLLAGCATAPQTTQIAGSAAQSELIDSFAVATLAPVGTFEWRAAPAYTQLAVLIHKAEKKLRRGEISVEEAVQVHRTATDIRAQLNGAVKLGAEGKTEVANKLLMAAGVQILALQSALNSAEVQP